MLLALVTLFYFSLMVFQFLLFFYYIYYNIKSVLFIFPLSLHHIVFLVYQFLRKWCGAFPHSYVSFCCIEGVPGTQTHKFFLIMNYPFTHICFVCVDIAWLFFLVFSCIKIVCVCVCVMLKTMHDLFNMKDREFLWIIHSQIWLKVPCPTNI